MIELNGHTFEKVPGAKYKYDYEAIVKKIESGQWNKLEAIRKVILNDLWFIIYFVMGIKTANHPFVIKMCQEIENDNRGKVRTLDVWARYHFKTTIITVAETAQYHLKNPEHCTCIFSFKAPAAQERIDSIRNIWETPIMIACFPDILYSNPSTQAPSWSLQNGITIRRKNKTRPESTVMASGLVEGMLTGFHFERRVFDDIETFDMADSPEEMDKCYRRFDMADNLGTGQDTDVERVIGTFYNHNGPIKRIQELKDDNSEPVYKARIIPVTDDGTPTGVPVLLSELKHQEIKKKEHYNSQHLCDPTPKSDIKLNPAYLLDIEQQFIPKNLHKVLLVDPAGNKDTSRTKNSDAWSIMLLGVEPIADDMGQWKRFILDAFVDKLSESEAVEIISRMYLTGGVVQKFGYEKIGGVTPHVAMQVVELLKRRGRYLSETNKSLVWLHPANRSKQSFISSALHWPLNNSKWFISKSVPSAFRDRVRLEMEKFPSWHDDALNTMAYLEDVIKDTRFGQTYRQYKPIQYRSLGLV